MADALSPQQAVAAAATRISSHQTELRRRYPRGFARLRQFHEQRGSISSFTWPDWCWLPMAGAAVVVRDSGSRDLDDIDRLAAVGQWTLAGRHIVFPEEQVTTLHIPNPHRGIREVADMDVSLDRDLLLAELAGHCYYLINPATLPSHTETPHWWPAGFYVHLEYDASTGRAKLQMVLDRSQEWTHLTPAFLYLDQPTLAWSARDAAQSMAHGIDSVSADDIAVMVRALAFMAWPVLATLLDRHTTLTGPTPLSESDVQPALLRGTKVWYLTTGAPDLFTA